MAAFDFIPSPVLGILLVVALSLLIEIGYRFGLWLSSIVGERGLNKHPMEASVTTALVGLLAFMLGFTFSLAAKRYADLRELALADANHASTVLLRADLLPEPYRAQAKALAGEYIAIRDEASSAGNADLVPGVLRRSAEIQQELWTGAVAALKQTGDVSLNLYLTAINQLMDTDASRQSRMFSNRFPSVLWFTLFFLTGLVTAMIGVNSGLHGRRSRLASTALIVAVSLVIVLIIDLDRPFRSLIRPAGVAIKSDLPVQ